jgi:hypothetical protein
MREEKSFPDVGAPAVPSARAVLSWAEWESLPVTARVTDWLVEILVLASELRMELESDEAAQLRWIVPEIDRVCEETDKTLRRLAF